MSPTQVCVLLAAVLAAGLGAPLARSAPAAAASPRLLSAESAWPAGQAQFGPRLTPAAAADTQLHADYQLVYYDYDQAEAAPAADSGAGQTAPLAGSPAAGEVGDQSVTRPAGETLRSSDAEPAPERVTARPGVPVIGRSTVSRRRASRRRHKIAPTVSSQTHQRRATKRSDGLGRAKTTPATSPRPASEPRPDTYAATTTTTTAPPKTAAALSSLRAGRSRDQADSAAAAEASTAQPAVDKRRSPLDMEQEALGSSRVLTYHVQHTQHSRVAKSPRETPDFFVPPIRRQPSRRRVPLISDQPQRQSQAGYGRSLGAQLAQQVRRQLAELQQQQQPASSTTERPYQHPFIPSSPTPTSEPYKHPFIPAPPTTTSQPYVHPFIPSSPTTTSEPYVHPFIPSSPTTTSEPYVHPFIPSSPTTTSEPYQHPHIPVPPESTRQPPVTLTTTAAPPQQQEQRQQQLLKQQQQQQEQREQQLQERQEQQVQQQQQLEQKQQEWQLQQERRRQQQEQQQERQHQQQQEQQQQERRQHETATQERPQARRIPSGSEAAVPRLHLPRRPAPSPAAEPASSTAAPAPAAAATIVHQQKVEAGLIVGEYGELGGGGTVRGVKYAADSSVDRSLLEAALRQFLEL